MSTISVVIPVYKKADMVMKNLAHNVPLLTGMDIVVIDDASGDGLAQRMRDTFPTIRVIENKKNKGFAPTVNRGVRHAKSDYVILLGSDVRLLKPFPKDITVPFQDPNLFAISFMQTERDGARIGKNKMYFHKGLPHHEKTDTLDKGTTGWADGGSSIVRTAHFKALGGFNELYAPFYWEDTDLSYRAYSRGWHVLFDPKLHVEHHHESTIGTLFDRKRITTIAYRNQFIFTWTNITDMIYWLQHLLYLPYYLIVFGIKGDQALVVGFFKALIKLPDILKRRSEKKRMQKVSDAQIFELVR